MPSSAGSSESGSERAVAAGGGSEADCLVIFGITGDLARVMTFRSLYRLERRGLLKCPIVGVAAQDWSVEHLREHARECIEGAGESLDAAVFERFAARLSYVSGRIPDKVTWISHVSDEHQGSYEWPPRIWERRPGADDRLLHPAIRVHPGHQVASVVRDDHVHGGVEHAPRPQVAG